MQTDFVSEFLDLLGLDCVMARIALVRSTNVHASG